jgi:hypothetical protein
MCLDPLVVELKTKYKKAFTIYDGNFEWIIILKKLYSLFFIESKAVAEHRVASLRLGIKNQIDLRVEVLKNELDQRRVEMYNEVDKICNDALKYDLSDFILN